ncbi:class I SAM-dependent methyltransferase [Mesorhizobium sp. 113-3-3]|uniref:class I SAM-dependent methyltransferase n=1 Tax=Mesorhizobium sp. 113-3-3 TaxID=2744516 RepID=UPI001927F6E9|nr:class I SAM-dependent methyltransferase [Mesorhizobium sp. 113-3-3]BCG79533.1 hypothetical protein MesoLj113b_30750 [Mesorhizobium sp. 113-3-3]
MLRDIARNTLPLGLRIAIRKYFPPDPKRVAFADVAKRIQEADHTRTIPAGPKQPIVVDVPKPPAISLETLKPEAPPAIVAPSSRPIFSLQEFDSVLAEVKALPTEQERVKVLANCHLADPTIITMPDDPFSAEYRQRVLDIYYKLSNRQEYSAAECERSPININKTILKPSVYTNDGAFLGNYLEAYGQIIKQMNVTPGIRVLEYGPGDGQISLHLARLGCDVTVVDVDPSYLSVIQGQAERLGVAINTVHGDFLTGAEFEPFDRIFFFQAFHHSLVHQEALHQMRGMLKPGGFLVFAAEPIIDPSGYWAPAVPYPWGPRLDGLSLRAIMVHGWMELGFQEPYFREALTRAGWAPDKYNSPTNGLAYCYFART